MCPIHSRGNPSCLFCSVRGLALALALVSCGAGSQAGGPPITVQASPGTLAWALTEYAVREWSEAGVPVVQGPGGVRVSMLARAQVVTICGGVPADGCTTGLGRGPAPQVYLAEGLSPARARMAALHEVGHAIRGKASHLDCQGDVPGPDVMCPSGAAAGTTPTQRDVDFVTWAGDYGP